MVSGAAGYFPGFCHILSLKCEINFQNLLPGLKWFTDQMGIFSRGFFEGFGPPGCAPRAVLWLPGLLLACGWIHCQLSLQGLFSHTGKPGPALHDSNMLCLIMATKGNPFSGPAAISKGFLPVWVEGLGTVVEWGHFLKRNPELSRSRG